MLALAFKMTALSFGAKGDLGMISEKDVETYRRDGVIVVPDVPGRCRLVAAAPRSS